MVASLVARPQRTASIFCKPFHDKVLRMASMIVEVPEDYERYKSGQPTGESRQCSTKKRVRFQPHRSFDRWMDNTLAIRRIVNATVNLAKYEQYLSVWLTIANFLR